MNVKNICRTLLLTTLMAGTASQAQAADWSIDFTNTGAPSGTEVVVSDAVTIINRQSMGLGSYTINGEKTLWEGTLDASTQWANIAPISGDTFSGYGEDTQLRVYTTIVNSGWWGVMVFAPTGETALNFKGWTGNGNKKNLEMSQYNSSGGYFELTFSNSTVDIINDKGGLTVGGWGIKVTKVTVVGNTTTEFDPKLVLDKRRNGGNWKLNGNLTNGDSGGRYIGLRLCKKGQTIIINGNQPNTTAVNATYVSSSGNNHTYTVNSGGDVAIEIWKGNSVNSIRVTGEGEDDGTPSGYVDATISSATGYATFCSNQPIDFSGVTDLKAYIAKCVTSDYVALEQVTGHVAANTGLVLIGKVGTVSLPIASTAGTSYTGSNLLVGWMGTDPTAIMSASQYVLTDEDGFAEFSATTYHAAVIYAGHAYLQANSGARRLMVSIPGNADAISSPTAPTADAVYYSLGGQRVEHPVKGIYVVNGKKVVVK